MLKYVGFVFALIVTIALCVGLNRPIKTSSSTLPPLGSLLSPATGFWQNAERHRKSNQKINLEGLSGDVKVVYDDRLVPHVFADTDLDAMRVQGYIHAQHRLWQMDISIRATGGQLAEIMGPDLIARDKSQRRLGFDYAADKAVKAWQQNPETFAYIEAYRDGINDYIATLSPRDYPLEFKLLNYKPTPWTIKKTAIFIKSMAQTLCFREDDLEASNALRHFGPETFEFLYPEWNPKQSPIIPTGTDWNVNITAPEEEGLTPSKNVYGYRPYHKPDPFLGSNNWAVSGDKTASGNPILCNDPHLSLTLPSIWYEIQIKTPNMNSYGVSLPGVPGVIIGFNNDIAWGQTNVGHDVTDWYDIQWTNESETKYMLDGEETPVEWRIEKINVAGGEPIIDSVKYTKWGPVVHTEGGYEGMALRWIAHDITGDAELQTFIGLNQAKNYDDY
ncbi:MAG: penicillin acylase family protein, partial [Bacteroidota bacterium]